MLAIGPRISQSKLEVTGPSMMFELLINSLTECGWSIDIIDIVDHNSTGSERKVGGFSLNRIWFYIKLAPKIWINIVNEKKLVYLIIAPTLAAFVRDALVIWSSYFLRRKIVCQLFGDYINFYSKQGSFVQKMIKNTLSKAEIIIVEGDLVKQYMSFVKDYYERIKVIPNGLPESNIKIPTKSKNLNKDSIIHILYMSNMIETKGYMDVLSAINILVNKRNRKVVCKFAGKFIVTSDAIKYKTVEQAEKAFNRYIEINQLTDFVSYSTRILDEQKKEEFNKAHFFVLPSNYVFEMQPVSILEAMAYGTVSIGTDHKMIPEMIRDDVTGCVVPYAAPEIIADKIEALINKPDKYEKMSLNSMDIYKSEYSADIYCEKIKNVLLSVAE